MGFSAFRLFLTARELGRKRKMGRSGVGWNKMQITQKTHGKTCYKDLYALTYAKSEKDGRLKLGARKFPLPPISKPYTQIITEFN